MDLVGKIMDYEDGNMSSEDSVRFFGELVRNGMAWTLQGSYGRTAMALIDAGLIDRDGNVNEEKLTAAINN